MLFFREEEEARGGRRENFEEKGGEGGTVLSFGTLWVLFYKKNSTLRKSENMVQGYCFFAQV